MSELISDFGPAVILCPQFGQKELPSFTFFPHLEQNISLLPFPLLLRTKSQEPCPQSI
jgi:hypothetical protein